MPPEVRGKKEPPPYTAQQRAQAVLSIWTERRRLMEVSQELAISLKVLSQWETRALSGMLKALEAPTRREPGPALSPKLERLLARQALQQKGRMARLEKPGPKKVAPLTLEELRGEVARLHHGQHRSRGVGALYRQYHAQVSRRDLEALPEAGRRALAQQRQAELCHITWHVPGLVWSLDDAALAKVSPHLLHLHQVQDLASRYKFPPWVGERILGETVALRLEQLFWQHGPPLVLKRDNGGNLNQPAVEEVLARYLVMPLNSPPYYPPYNGGMERAVRELKTPLVEKILASGPIPASQVQVWAEGLAHALNHRPRRCLAGQVACRVFQDARPALKAYTRRKRREVFDAISALTQRLIQARAVHTQRQAETARRLAVETWLQSNGVTTITQNKEVLPIFLKETAHN